MLGILGGHNIGGIKSGVPFSAARLFLSTMRLDAPELHILLKNEIF